MSLTSAISKATQGLRASARGTDIVSTNITNAQTPGYVRREIELGERLIDGVSVGLNPIRVTRHFNAEVTNSVRRAQISYQQQDVIAQSFEEIVFQIGDVNSEFSLSGRFDRFMNSMKNLSETPENSALQDETIGTAKDLVNNIRDISSGIQSIRERADAEIKREVDNVNELLHQLKNISGEIAALNSSSDTNGLQDERDRLIDEISQKFPISASYNEDGSVRVSSSTGVTLLDISVTEIEFSQTATIPPNVIYSYAGEEPGLPYNSTLSGLIIKGTDYSPTANKIQSLEGGRIGGLFKIRDEETVTIQRQLDNIAAQLIQTFRAGDTTIPDLHTNGTTDGIPDGVRDGDSLFTSNIPGQIFNDIDDMLGLSNALRINASIDPSQGGDRRRIRDGAGATTFGPDGQGDIIRGWLDQTQQLLSFESSSDLTLTQSIGSAIKEMVSSASLRSQSEQSILRFEEGKLNTLKDQKDNLEGVNLDDEMNDLVFLQQFYSANAVILQRADEMLQLIIDIT